MVSGRGKSATQRLGRLNKNGAPRHSLWLTAGIAQAMILVAAYDQRARVAFLGPTGNHIGHKESIKGTARVLGRVYDAFVGDAANNMGDSLLIGGAKRGVDVRLCGPKACWPTASVQEEAQKIANDTGAQILISEDVDAAVKSVDFVYTDVWVSMGEPKGKWADRIKLLIPYQVNAALMAKTDNPRGQADGHLTFSISYAF